MTETIKDKVMKYGTVIGLLIASLLLLVWFVIIPKLKDAVIMFILFPIVFFVFSFAFIAELFFSILDFIKGRKYQVVSYP